MPDVGEVGELDPPPMSLAGTPSMSTLFEVVFAAADREAGRAADLAGLCELQAGDQAEGILQLRHELVTARRQAR